MKISYLPVVENDMLAYLLPSCSNQMLIHDVQSSSGHFHVTVCHIWSLSIFLYLIVYYCKNWLTVQERTCKYFITLHQENILKRP